MNTTFDYNQFESLKGFELGMYYSKWVVKNAVDESFMEYFRQKANSLDNEHLEIALALLHKMSSVNAFREIAKYMHHPYASVRLFAINTISHLPSIDETIMPYVISTLANPVDSLGIRELREALEHASNTQAKILVERYLKKLEEKCGN